MLDYKANPQTEKEFVVEMKDTHRVIVLTVQTLMRTMTGNAGADFLELADVSLEETEDGVVFYASLADRKFEGIARVEQREGGGTTVIITPSPKHGQEAIEYNYTAFELCALVAMVGVVTARLDNAGIMLDSAGQILAEIETPPKS